MIEQEAAPVAQEQPAAPAAPAPAPRGANEQAPKSGIADAFGRVVEAAMRVLYSKGTSDGVVQMLQKGGPVNALAQTTLFVMKALFDESKGKIPAPIMVPASRAVLTLLAEMGGVMGLAMDENVVNQAMQLVEGSLNKRFAGEQPAPEQPQPGAQEPEPQQPAEPAQPTGIINQARAA